VAAWPEAKEAFLDHLKPLQFWSETGLPVSVWHFHPLQFIRHFRRCGWLTKEELLQLLPSNAMRKSKDSWVSEKIAGAAAEATIKRNLTELNKACRKFGITTPLRLAAFYANSTQETQWFQKLHENNSTAKYAPWDGRGFLQLTWPDAYIKYWRFRGRSVPKTVADALNKAAKKANEDGKNETLEDGKITGLTQEMIGWRANVGDEPLDAAHSAGAYWMWTEAARFADKTPSNERKTQPIGKTSHTYYRCESFGQVAATVNFGSPRSNTTDIDKVNGIVARFQSYSNALVVLTDTPRFPDKDGSDQVLPEDFEPRRTT